MPENKPTTKICSRCGKAKPVSEYYGGKSGNQCRACKCARLRMQRAGLVAIIPRGDIATRIKRRSVVQSNGCWIWPGKKTKAGYGFMQLSEAGRKRWVLAHRASAQVFLGVDISSRWTFICHRCDNPGCVNPDHLFVGTPKENTQDSVSKGRWPSGERSANAKLTISDVIEIRALRSAGWKLKQLSDKFGIAEASVSKIVLCKSWRGV